MSNARTSLEDGLLLVADVETTGLDPTTDRVVSVGLAYFLGGAYTRRRYECVINPGEAAIAAGEANGAAAVHQLSADTLRVAQPFAEIAPAIRDHILGLHSKDNPPPFIGVPRVLVGYNSDYDVAMLSAEFARAGLCNPLLEMPFVDPRWFLWHRDPTSSTKLGTVCQTYGIPLAAHNASDDARATGVLLCTLVRTGIIPTNLREALVLQQIYKAQHTHSRDLFAGWAIFDAAGALQLLKGPKPGALVADLDTWGIRAVQGAPGIPPLLAEVLQAELQRRGDAP